MREWWSKGQTIKGGFVQLRQYQEFLKTLIERENARPSFLFSEEFRIEEAAQAFKEFDARKVIKTLFKYDTPKKSLEIKCTMVLIEGE
jgi:threonine dehydrogenase-like Zn-dependent dehydrogenase